MNDHAALLEKFTPGKATIITPDIQLSQARYTPCGLRLIGGGYDARVRRWDASTDDIKELPALAGHSGWCTALAFHAAEKLVYSADSWGRIIARNYEENEPAVRWDHAAAHNGWVRDLAVNREETLLASCGSDQRVRLYDSLTGTEKANWNAGEDTFLVRFHPEEQALFTGDFRGVVKRWSLAGECLKEYKAEALFALNRLQDVGGVRTLAIDAEGKTLAVGGTQPKTGGTVTGTPTLFLFDVASGEEKARLELGTTQEVNVVDVAFHPAGFLMALTCGTPGQGKFLYVHPAEKTPFFEYKNAQNPQSFSIRPDGLRIAITATNAGSNGNGRPVKDGVYRTNHSPIHVLPLPAKT